LRKQNLGKGGSHSPAQVKSMGPPKKRSFFGEAEAADELHIAITAVEEE